MLIRWSTVTTAVFAVLLALPFIPFTTVLAAAPHAPAVHHHDGADVMEEAPQGPRELAAAGPITTDAGPVLDGQFRQKLAKEFPTAPFTTMAMGHMMSEGVPLHGGGSGPGMISLYPKDPSVETVSLTGGLCPPGTPTRSYDIAAIALEITLNRFLDFDPQGRMYVLTENRVKALQEAQQNANARAGLGQPAVSIGLQGDIIQPLVIRANQGECLVINFSNNLAEPASIHIHGSSAIVAGANVPAIAANPASIASPGGSVTYQWFIKPDQQEGTYYFHSHGNMREQTAHGLFGMVIVEKAGSQFLNPWTGQPLKSGWFATIVPPSGPSFREFAVFYHEVGNDNFQIRDKNNNPQIMSDFVTGAYKWGGRVLNYRGDPFRDRLLLINQRHGFFDESMAYGSYTNGDPPAPMPRSYLGDPIKWRLAHGGSEVWHVHHYHGGSIRWKRQPGTGDTRFDVGLSKFPPLTPDVQEPGRPAPSFSDFVDAQSIGPSETFDLESECGSGGCQQVAGDFLWHCHVAHHYLGGMWSLHRVYNTLQNGPASTDNLPPLQELPDRQGRMKPAVTSAALVGTTVDWFSTQAQGGISGTQYKIVSGPTDLSKSPPEFSLTDWVEQQLPPQGKPGNALTEAGQIQAYDATVHDWIRTGNTYFNEPETAQVWPNFASPTPGQRLPILFDPTTGKLAYPFLHPHLGKRAPFPPNHGPAPFLEPIHLNSDGTRSTEPAKPGENGLWSLCPERSPENPSGTPRKFYNIHALPVEIPLNPDVNNPVFGFPLVDTEGRLFVLHEERADVLADNSKKVPLAIRANARDCVDVVLKSELLDTFENFFLSKVNLHIHFVQFDPQGSDGVITGFNYEGSVRPFNIIGQTGMQQPMNTTLAAGVPSGSTTITVADASRFHPNIELGIGMEQPATFEVGRIVAIAGNTITLAKPLQNSHGTGELVSVEFVRHRWYPDVQNGITYFHDHVNGIASWKHGQFGAIVIEPPHSTYHDPATGAEIRSGIVADIHTAEKLTTDVTGAFRELVMLMQDDNPLTKFNPVGQSGSLGSSLNLRVEPLPQRFALADPSVAFSSLVHGDPHTHLLKAYLGDPVVIRMHQTGAHETHSFHVDGHWWRGERFSPLSLPKNTQHVGIAERYDLVIPSAGGPQQKPGDYLFSNARRSKLREGSWGLLRVFGQTVGELQPLPGRTIPPSPPVCPPTAPFKFFQVSAINKTLDLGNGTSINGRIYVLGADKAAVLAGTKPPQPLVLHVNVGDCVNVQFTNELASGRASFHVEKMAYDPAQSYGANVGLNPLDQTAGPGESRTYVFYAHPQFGEGGVLIRDYGLPSDVITPPFTITQFANPRNGLFGAIIVGPPGAQYFDPVTGEDVSKKSRVAVDVVRPILVGSPVQIGNTLCRIQAILNTTPLASLVQLFCTTPDQNTIALTTVLASRYRDYALFFQDEDEKIGVFTIPYPEAVTGLTSVNYKAAPLSQRQAFGPENAFRADLFGDPPTPVFQAFVGDPVVFHVFGPSNEQNQVFAIENHQWPLERFMPGADLLGSFQFGAAEMLDMYVKDGAGGAAGLPGNYLWLNHRLPYLEAGQWGYFRVCATVPTPGSPTCTVRPLAVQGVAPPLPGL
ncbi:multicopper oxidase domain-containing protein [Nitrospira sp. Kam-Ns4a]